MNKKLTTINMSKNGIEDHLVGMTEEQALRTLKLNGVENIRILMKDSIITLEDESDRINLIIDGGKVIGATRG